MVKISSAAGGITSISSEYHKYQRDLVQLSHASLLLVIMANTFGHKIFLQKHS